MKTVWNEVKLAIRTLRRAPGFASVVVLTMGLGIGANTAIFSLLNSVMLKSLPVASPEELVVLEDGSWTNPISPSPENIEAGKILFDGKGFCVTCHGKDGKGLGNIPGLRGKLPRNFTDKKWQAARTDGELFWILKNGSPGTDMASFVPLVLTEEQAWHVVLYVRSFGQP